MEKFIDWIKKTGWTNIGLLAAALLCIVLQPFLWKIGATVCATLFVYINWNTLRKQAVSAIGGGGIKNPK